MDSSLSNVFKSLVVAVTCGAGVLVSAQNLIPNPSFEELEVLCEGPVSYSDLNDWTLAGCTINPALYNACSALNGFPNDGTPSNAFGHQEPVDGQAYITMLTYLANVSVTPPFYATCPLLEPLVADVEYCFSAHVSLVDRAAYRTRDMHVFLSDAFPSACNGLDTSVWVNDAQLVLNTTDVDTASWVLLSGSFSASGGESYLTIGNFNARFDPDTIYIAPSSVPWQSAMYYLDVLDLRPCASSVPEHGTDELLATYDPATQELMISAAQAREITDVVLFDASGRIVRSFKGGFGTIRYAVGDLPHGIYVVHAGTKGTRLSSRVVIH